MTEYYNANSAELNASLDDSTTWRDAAYRAMAQNDFDAWMDTQTAAVQLLIRDGMNYVGAKNEI